MAQDAKSNSKSMVRDLTKGNVARQLFVFAAPLFLSNALQAIYNIVDMIIVGQVMGGKGMAAVAISGNIQHLLCFVAMGFAGAGQIIIAQKLGAKDMEGVKKTIGTLFTMLLIAAVMMTVICLVFRIEILKLVNTPEEAFGYAMDYTIIGISGLIFAYGYNVVSAIMRGLGDSKRPFIFVAFASVLNIVLDVLFVVIFGWEVRGAALATIIGQAVSFLWALWYLYKNRENFVFDFKLRSFAIDKSAAAGLLKLGIPMAIQSAAINVSMTVVSAWVNSFGYIASAMAGMISKLNTLAGILSASISTAAGAMIGQNIGAQKFDRVPVILKNAFGVSIIISMIICAVVYIFPNQTFAMFTSDKLVLANASIIIGPFILNCVGASTRTFGFAMINGSGNSRLNLLIAILDGMVARLSLAYIIGFMIVNGPQGFWYGDAIAGFVPMLIGGVYFLSGKWRKIRV